MKALRLKIHHFHAKLPYQKPMWRQIEWWLQNGPITKNRVLPVTTLVFWKYCFSLRTSYNELVCCTDNPNAHICTFCKRWSFIWRCFFPESILNWFSVIHKVGKISTQSDVIYLDIWSLHKKYSNVLSDYMKNHYIQHSWIWFLSQH